MGTSVSSRRRSSGSQFDMLTVPMNGSRDNCTIEDTLAGEENRLHEDSRPILPTGGHNTDHTMETDDHVEHRFSGCICSLPTGRSSSEKDEGSTSASESEPNQDRNERIAKSRASSTQAEEEFDKKILFLFSVADFMLLACLISIWVMNPRQKGIKHEGSIAAVENLSPEDSSFCLPCEEIYMNSLEVQQNRFKVHVTRDEKNNVSLCCDQEHSDLKHFAQSMYLRVHYQRDRARGVITLSNNTSDANIDLQVHSLHLAWTLDTAGHLTETGGKFSVPLRKRDTTSAPTSRFLELENNVVNVKETGLYYLYSQVPFKLGAATHDARHLTQFVYRLRQGADELLLQNSVSPCQLVEETKMQSFVGGLFRLNADDALCLRVSDATAVDAERKFQFGVHHI